METLEGRSTDELGSVHVSPGECFERASQSRIPRLFRQNFFLPALPLGIQCWHPFQQPVVS